MAACEDCWERAQWRVFMSGGSVVDRYQELIAEPYEHAHPTGGPLERGLADSAAGRVVDLGDFTQYVSTERLDAGNG